MGDDRRPHDLERFLRFAGYVDGELLELRALGGPPAEHATASSARDAVGLADLMTERAEHAGVYLVANAICAGMKPHGWRRAMTDALTVDAHITHRRLLCVDVDPDRPRGTSATDEERTRARLATERVARTIDDLLFARRGAPRDAIATGSSGNGGWVLVALDRLPETPVLRPAVRRILHALRVLCGGRGVTIDQTVDNASRVIPAWGTMKRKGANTPERPHRVTELVDVPDRVDRLSMADVLALCEDLEALAGEAPKPAAQNAATRVHGDVFALANGVPIRDVAKALGLNPRGNDTKPVVDCPSGCTGSTSVVLLTTINRHKCSHNTCADKRGGLRSAVDLWSEVRGVSPLVAARAVCELGGIEVLTAPSSPDVPAQPSALANPDAWRWLADVGPGWLTNPPKPRRWLLTQRDGTGVLPLGKVGMLAAAGGVGKTMALAQLAIAVASGRAWLNTYTVPNPGAVLLALAEEDAEEMQRRLFNAAQLMELTDDELERVGRNVVVLPLAGERVALVQGEGGEVTQTQTLATMRERLATMRGKDDRLVDWRLIILDPLSRWAGSDTEKDNAAATRFVEAAETLALHSPGAPTVLVAHHTAKVARVEGGAGNATAPRGVTGLVDGVRWVAEMDDVRADGIECVKLTIPSKSNYSRLCSKPLVLARDRDHGGALRPLTPEESAAFHAQPEAVPSERNKAARRGRTSPPSTSGGKEW